MTWWADVMDWHQSEWTVSLQVWCGCFQDPRLNVLLTRAGVRRYNLVIYVLAYTYACLNVGSVVATLGSCRI